MVYDVRIVEPPGDSRFDHECAEPLKEGQLFTPGNVTYEVLRILPENENYDGVAEVAWRVGPPVFGRD
jgi:hypothetical protein